MRTFHYHLVDVFTERAFGGNQLAVFPDAQGLSPQTMQALAKELNLSETTFVLPPQDRQHTYHVRIFTPAVELPMAGHPTIGTAFTLAHEHKVEWSGEATAITFEEGVGVIPVTLRRKDDGSLFIQMRQPQPTFGAQFSERHTIAEMLSLEEAELDAQLPLEVVSTGVPFLYIPVKDLATIRKIRFRRDIWERVLSNFEASQLFVFTRETETSGATTHSRMFAPAMGILEDPATGAACGPLGCYLVRHLKEFAAPNVEILNEQGFEIGRPSLLHIKIEQAEGHITGVYVGGQCHYMGQGYFKLD